MRKTARVIVMAMVLGLGLQVSVANAGLRHLRVFCRGCGPVYAAPAYVATPASSCACGASVMSYSQPSCCQSAMGGAMFQPNFVAPGFGEQIYSDPAYPAISVNGGFGNGFGPATLPPSNSGGLPYQYTPFPIVAGEDLVW